MDRFLGWWKGKKTILGGGLVMVGAIAAVFCGRLDPSFAIVVFGFGASIAGYGDKANRHQAELLTALEMVAKVGADTRAGTSIGEATVKVTVDTGELASVIAQCRTNGDAK